MTTLHIGKSLSANGHNFTLPLDTITDTIAILAVKGSGKSYTASIMAEEMLRNQQPIVVLDPTGAWFGLKSSADGKSEGYPVVVFGGDHADVPLEDSAGDIIAQAIIEKRFSAILDFSNLRKGQQIKFMTAFAETLYHLNRDPLHLFVDEADAFAPQKIFSKSGDGGGNAARLLGAMEDIVRRGRKKGIGCTMITQRPAVLNKDVLTQCSTLVCLRMGYPNDIAAIHEWVKQHGTPEDAMEIVKSLPSLPIGHAWFWAPAHDTRERVAVRKRETFDSGATPKFGVAITAPKIMARVDIARLGETIKATVERAKENDPTVLKAKLAMLQIEHDKLKNAPPPKQAPAEIREIQIFDEDTKREILEGLERLQRLMTPLMSYTPPLIPAAEPTATQRLRAAIEPPRSHPEPTPPPQPAEGISGPQQRILNALVSMESLGIMDMDKSNAAVFSDQSPTSSSYMNNIGRLRTLGYVQYPTQGRISLTTEGRALASGAERILSRRELHQAWFSKISRPKARILEELINIYPSQVPKDELASLAGASPTSSSYNNNIGNLRSLGLIEYPERGYVAATALLFPRPLP